jgi:putative transposase
MRFPLSFRAVEEMMLLRGVQVSYETIRRWCHKFAQQFANELRRRRPRPGDKWHLDEVFLKISGQTYYLWRAVDQEGNVLDVLVQSRRNAAAAKRLMRKLMKKIQCVPRVLITDKLKSPGAQKSWDQAASRRSTPPPCQYCSQPPLRSSVRNAANASAVATLQCMPLRFWRRATMRSLAFSPSPLPM